MRPLTAPRRGPAARNPKAPRRDPAPSRVAYRLQRLWLTPLFRTALRVGLPAFALSFGIGVYLADADRRAGLVNTYAELRDTVKNRPEFLVSLLSVEGASPELADLVRQTLALPLPLSSLDLDLSAAHARIAAIDAVAEVLVRVQPGGILQVMVTEREPAVVWRQEVGTYLLDQTGTRVAEIVSRADRADLPLLAGDGAEQAVPEALQILTSAGPLLPRLRGLVRMGERRWDVVLDRDQRILLPAENPVRALERLIALDQAQDVLDRDVATVDLRLQDRPTLGLAPHALTEMRRLRGIVPAENDL